MSARDRSVLSHRPFDEGRDRDHFAWIFRAVGVIPVENGPPESYWRPLITMEGQVWTPS
jgi:hypothetical protein